LVPRPHRRSQVPVDPSRIALAKLVDWLFNGVMESKIGIFEAKTKLSEICTQVEERAAEYVITRRGRSVARIVPIEQDDGTDKEGIRERMDRTCHQYGPVSEQEPDFPEVWKERSGSRPDPLAEPPHGGA